MQDLEASIAEEQRVFMAAAHQLGHLSCRKELTSCKPEILLLTEVFIFSRQFGMALTTLKSYV